MRLRTALNIAFEAAATAVLFSVSWSTYGSAVRRDINRPDTNAMIALTFLGGSIALLLLAQSLLKLRRTEARDPEEGLRELIGPKGIAQRDRNRAAAQKNLTKPSPRPPENIG